MGKLHTNDTEHPALVEWLQAHAGDVELKALTVAYKAAAGRLAAHKDRQTETEKRIVGIDAALVDAHGKERAVLLTRRAEVAADLASLPSTLAALRERHKAAHLAFLKHIANVAKAEVAQYHERLLAEWPSVVKTRKEIHDINSGVNPSQAGGSDQALADLIQKDRARVSELQPLIEKRDAALRVQKVAELRMENYQGGTLRPNWPSAPISPN